MERLLLEGALGITTLSIGLPPWAASIPGTTLPAMATTRDDGFAMPAEFARHQATWMSWPTSRELWDGRLDEARDEWAGTTPWPRSNPW